MKNFKIYTLLLVSAFMTFSCDEEDKLISDILEDTALPSVDGEPGSLDLSNYVALGNSLTAGFQDGALYTSGQQNSFCALLSKQFQSAGLAGSDYVFPDINSENGYYRVSKGVIEGKLILNLGEQDLEATEGENKIGTRATADQIASLTNFGVPGINISDLDNENLGNPGSPDFNPYYLRFSSDPVTFKSTVLDDAIAREPSLVSLWIGANDYLSYALDGASSGALTDQGTFQTQLVAHLTKLVSSPSSAAAKGVVLNLPPVTLLPYFRAIPYNPIPMTEQAQVDAVNGAYANYNAGVQGALANKIITQEEADKRTISFDLGDNGAVIIDEYLTDVATLSGGAIPIPKYRQTDSTDLIILPAKTVLGTLADPSNESSVIGVGVAVEDSLILTYDEQVEVVTARATFNGVIDAVLANAAFANYKLVDVHPFFADAFGLSADQATALALSAAGVAAADGELGITYQGIDYSPDFTPNGLWSNDAVHPNPRGHGIVANQVINVLNEEFEASIPLITIQELWPSPFKLE